jgi:hypothetical protein
MPEQLTLDEFLGLFGRTRVANPSISSADSEEYLTLVMYLVERPHHRQHIV